MTTATRIKRGRDRNHAGDKSAPDYPYTMKLPDGRMIYIEIPGRYVSTDRSGETVFLPPAVRLLDKVKVLAMSMQSRPITPGYLKTLRAALGLTLTEMAERVGVEKMTVWRWENGQLTPRKSSLSKLERARREAVRKGTAIPS